MLNAPRAHPSFGELPPVPHQTISVSHAARMEFSLVEMLPEESRVSLGDSAASITGTFPLTAPRTAGSPVIGTHDADLAGAGRCLVLRATGDDPHVVSPPVRD